MTLTTTSRIETLELQVREALELQNLEAVRALLRDRHPADVADVIDRLDDDLQLEVFQLLEPDQAADVLGETSADATRELLEQLPAEQAVELLERMPVDDVAEILSEDVPERQQDLLAEMEPLDAAEVRALLQYPPQTAGRLMIGKFVQVQPELTAAKSMLASRR
jgi:magnesium transporter